MTGPILTLERRLHSGFPLLALPAKNLCFAIGLLSRCQSNLRLAHWQTIKRITRYIHGTADLVICYQRRDLKLRGYSDADQGGDQDEPRSTSGYVFILVGSHIMM